MDKYVQDFHDAVKFSYGKLSFSKPKIKNKNSSDIDLSEYLYNYLKVNDYPLLGVSAGQCIKWCFFLENIIEVAISMKAWITIGQLWDGDKPLFTPNFKDIKKWLSEGLHVDDMTQSGLNVHAWLTAENGSIIDLTLLSSMARVVGNEWKKYDGKVLLSSDKKILPNRRYMPMLVGSNNIRKMQKKSTIPFLASKPEELILQYMSVVEEIRN